MSNKEKEKMGKLEQEICDLYRLKLTSNGDVNLGRFSKEVKRLIKEYGSNRN